MRAIGVFTTRPTRRAARMAGDLTACAACRPTERPIFRALRTGRSADDPTARPARFAPRAVADFAECAAWRAGRVTVPRARPAVRRATRNGVPRVRPAALATRPAARDGVPLCCRLCRRRPGTPNGCVPAPFRVPRPPRRGTRLRPPVCPPSRGMRTPPVPADFRARFPVPVPVPPSRGVRVLPVPRRLRGTPVPRFGVPSPVPRVRPSRGSRIRDGRPSAGRVPRARLRSVRRRTRRIPAATGAAAPAATPYQPNRANSTSKNRSTIADRMANAAPAVTW